jgi:predicted nucleic acid-binding protein
LEVGETCSNKEVEEIYNSMVVEETVKEEVETCSSMEEEEMVRVEVVTCSSMVEVVNV